MFSPVWAACRSAARASVTLAGVALGAPLGQAGALIGLGLGVGLHDRAFAGGERGGFGGGEAVDADHGSFAGFDLGQAFSVGFNEAALHVGDGGDGPAHRVDVGEFFEGALLQRVNLAVDGGVAVEEVVIVQKVGLIGQDLLHPKRPLLVEGTGQAERLVPGGELHGAGAGVFREGDGQHLDQDTVDVVFGLLFGEAERVDLHPVAEAAEAGVGDAVAGFQKFVPEGGEGAHLAKFGHEADAGIDKKRHSARHCGEICRRDFHS